MPEASQLVLLPVPEAPECGAASAGPAGLTPLGISVTGEGESEAEKPRAERLWEQTQPLASTFLLVEEGISLCGDDQAGVLVDEFGERHAIKRKRAVPIERLAEFVPEEHRALFVQSAKALFRAGRVPPQIVTQFKRLTEETGWPAGKAGVYHAQHGLSHAVGEDALDLRDKVRAECGKQTFTYSWRDKNGEHCVWWRKPCRSHRCPSCAKLLGMWEANRLVRQLQRDEAQSRPPCVFFTVSVARDRYETSVEAQKDLLLRMRAYFRTLRKKYGQDLAYWYAVEFHAAGWPHAHMLVRSAGLVAAFLEDSKQADWPSLVSRCLAALTTKKGRRRQCPFGRERRLLNTLAVEVGLGRTGFYAEPVRDPEDVAHYLVKEQTRPSRSPVGRELTKHHQVLDTLPRHFRRFRPSGKAGDGRASSFYIDEPLRERPSRDTIFLGIIHAKPEEVRRALAEVGVSICGEVLSADMRGERGDDGKWPRVLEKFQRRNCTS